MRQSPFRARADDGEAGVDLVHGTETMDMDGRVLGASFHTVS